MEFKEIKSEFTPNHQITQILNVLQRPADGRPSTGSDKYSVNGECYSLPVQLTPLFGGPQADSQKVTCQGTGLGLKFKSGSEPSAFYLNLHRIPC